tara:strand:+ start:108 stop:314 length:207 start_codon:yes stop_codon:yes gene_type:complete
MSKKEIKLTNAQKYCQAQIDDLNQKLATLNFQIDQVKASLSVFTNLYAEETAKINNNSKEGETKNDDT